MKALELLQRNLINMAIAHPMESLGISGYEVKEAIAELEELIGPRMCDGCVYDIVDIPDDTCEDCARTYKDKYTPWTKNTK